jgi:hypothetical protein
MTSDRDESDDRSKEKSSGPKKRPPNPSEIKGQNTTQYAIEVEREA